jgi:hypothetical protein
MGTCCTVSSNVLVEMLVDDMSLLHDVLNECGIIIFFHFSCEEILSDSN